MALVNQKDLEVAAVFLKGFRSKIGDQVFWTAAGIKLATVGVHVLDRAGYSTVVPQAVKEMLETARKYYGEAAFYTTLSLMAVEKGAEILVKPNTSPPIDTTKVKVTYRLPSAAELDPLPLDQDFTFRPEEWNKNDDWFGSLMDFLSGKK